MLVQINTDNRIEGSEGTSDAMEDRLRERLSRFADRLTRVEVHLRDVDGDRSGPEGIEATVEVRPAGAQPLAATDRGIDADAALSGALRKAISVLDRTLAKEGNVR